VPAGLRSPSPHTQASQTPIPTFTSIYGYGSSNSHPPLPSKSRSSQSRSYTSTPSRSSCPYHPMATPPTLGLKTPNVTTLAFYRQIVASIRLSAASEEEFFIHTPPRREGFPTRKRAPIGGESGPGTLRRSGPWSVSPRTCTSLYAKRHSVSIFDLTELGTSVRQRQ
jgi:hypothetical protein